MSSKFWDYTSLTLVIIGAINWGLIGFFRFDLVNFLFGNMSWVSRVIYALVLRAVWRENRVDLSKTEQGLLSLLNSGNPVLLFSHDAFM